METRMLTANYVRPTEAYVADVFEPAFAVAAAAGPYTERRYLIADKRVLVRFFSRVLYERLSSALAHLEDDSAPVEPDLTIDAWDSVSSGTSFAPPWRDLAHSFPQQTMAQNAAAPMLGVYVNGEESMSIYDQSRRHAWFWVSDARSLPGWVDAAPFRAILSWFLPSAGVHLVHGAVVAEGGKAALLAARGGSGKSTTALACALAGMQYLADDYAGIKVGEEIIAHSLYSSVKIVPERAAQFPSLFPEAPSADGEKRVAYLSSAASVVRSAPLAGIFVPKICNLEKTRIVPISKAEVMIALAPTTLFQLPLSQAGEISTLAEIVRRTPCYYVELGTDSAEAAEVLRLALRALY